MAKARDKFAKTKSELADELGILRSNVAKSWSHREGWPPKTKQGYNIRLCMEFIRSEKEAARLKREVGPHADLKERKLKVECEILDVKLSVLKGDTIPMEEHLQEFATHAGIVKAVFRQWLEAVKASSAGLALIKEADRLEARAMDSLRLAIGAEAVVGE
ncbi:unnamed protein product [marine sediment metagenome]|uniref:Uncharacterized protein n=1 Tax=marine sediment metagenome TaxID=412755 RepID=X0UGG0_9ZZZZ